MDFLAFPNPQKNTEKTIKISQFRMQHSDSAKNVIATIAEADL